MNNKMVLVILPVLVIFLSWLLICYLGNEFGHLSDIKYLTIPFLWSCIFIYLHAKNYSYIAVNAYVIFLLMLFADILNFGNLTGSIQLSYLLVSMFTTFTFVLLYQDIFAKRPRVATAFSFFVSIILYAIPLFYIIYAINFSTVISKEVFYSILQTDQDEALEFYAKYISSTWVSIAFLFVFLIGFLLLKQEKKETAIIKKNLLIFLIAILFSLSYANKGKVRLYSFAKNAMDEYWREIALFREIQEKLNIDSIKFYAEKRETSETYLVVIGESLNKKHMSLYGYMRDTTPLLNKIRKDEGLVVFDNVFSSHTHTIHVLSQSLTEANQLNKKKYYDSLSIINILNEADIDTYWVTNQILYGAWDNLVSVIAHESDHLIALNHSIGKQTKTKEYDGIVINEVKNIVSKDSKKNRVIFVHLMGNHEHYCSRYPDEYKIFTEELKPSEFGKLSSAGNIVDSINCYDNSVLYNDYVVSSLIKVIQKKNSVTAVLYFSDHADDVIGQVGHNASKFTFSMTQIPMLVWFSEQYKNRYQEKFNIFKSHENALYSNDFIYNTLVGIININTDRYQATYDLSSSQYNLEEDNVYLLHKDIPYADKTNHLYHQKNNVHKIINTNQDLRIIPHRVNSIGKLKDIWFDGYRSFEIDVRYGEDNTDRFEIGHNHGVMSGISFEQFITSIQHSDIKKTWIDLKNLTLTNHDKVIARLSYLDRQFNLKGKLIIESGTTEEFFRKLSEEGWHTSYYLPTNKILKLIAESNSTKMKSLAIKIYKQSLRQKLSAFSFDHRLYPFVKNYLEPLLSYDIVFHLWDLSVKLYDKDLHTNLSNKNYFSDSRVRTILLPYKSKFNL